MAAGSIAVGVVVLGLKLLAWQLTGSAALFSDAAESVVNVVAAGFAFFALRFAAKPADANHPYGHHKAEFFSAVIEGVLIVLAAISILNEAWRAFLHPEPLDAPLLGVGVNMLATVLNASWGSLLVRAGRQQRSPALVGDGKHLLADVVTSVGVVFGVGLVVLTGLPWLDPLVAALTAVYILGSGTFLIRDSVGGLMDAAPPFEIVERIRQLVARHAVGALEAHDLRMRHAGRVTFLEFHLVVPGSMTVAEAHEICDRTEAALKAEVHDMTITIHVEPEGKAKHHGVIVL
ncbi:cation transporter [Rhodovastum atsumiense]|uniref:Cation transporter n=2 Tax=Rhodovastum atsumiense TaxID=504468 RepID=A0A5M6INS4_9PROT|nr:cation transporter [Rhodovastum atsumiense]